jgi:hypothetical protein
MQPHGILDMKAGIKLTCSHEFVKRALAKLSRPFDKFKTAPLEAEAQLPKLQLKSQNHTSINSS